MKILLLSNVLWRRTGIQTNSIDQLLQAEHVSDAMDCSGPPDLEHSHSPLQRSWIARTSPNATQKSIDCDHHVSQSVANSLPTGQTSQTHHAPHQPVGSATIVTACAQDQIKICETVGHADGRFGDNLQHAFRSARCSIVPTDRGECIDAHNGQ